MAYIKLSIAGFSITFSKFLADSIPRVEPNENNLEYSAYSTPALMGSFSEPANLWNVDAYCSREDYQKLLCLYHESDYRRRNKLDYRIVLEDTTLPFTERSPRTRAIVAGTSEETVSGTVDYTSYSARYYGWIVKRPDFKVMGKGWGASFTVQEAGKFPA